LSSCRSKGPALTPQYGDQPWLACAGNRRRTAGQLGTASTAQHGRHAFLGDGRERGAAARGSRRWDRACTDAKAAQSSARGAGRAGRAPVRRRRSRAQPSCISAGQPSVDRDFFPKKLNCATKTVDTKVVEETSLYNICKGYPMFFSTV
jgi:hypothetical protein